MSAENGGRATLRDVYAIAQEIRSEVASLREATEGRLDRLERWRARATGAAALVVAATPIALALWGRS